MHLTRATSYALHACAHLAASKSTAPITSHKIAEACKTPERFLLKVLKPLATAQLLESAKGPNGGYRLARPAKDISVLEIIEASEGTLRERIPVVEKADPANQRIDGRLRGLAQEAVAANRKRLGAMSIASLAGKA